MTTTTIDLTELSWQLRGWRPHTWRLGKSMETGTAFQADIAPMPIRLPGSVQRALREAGWLPDWNVGLNALTCEWVEHRHWEIFAQIPAGRISAGQRVELRADGLDHAGWILVDARVVGAFDGALLRHRIDLTEHLGDGHAHELAIVFDQAPPEQGQCGFTSQTRHFKPRYNYGWDWCPRLVTIGVWDRLRLVVGDRPVEVLALRSELADDLATGRITVRLDRAVEGKLAFTLTGPNGERRKLQRTLSAGQTAATLEVPNVSPWWPNGAGDQPLYDLAITFTPSQGNANASASGNGDAGGNGGKVALGNWRVGFKRVRWLPCEGAPDGAEPWVCEVNGRPIFLQGVNWTPIRADYHGLTPRDYAQRINLYRDMGCNTLRVWGGAFLERDVFYRLCDEVGLLVWQEFPLSSSGYDNWPPEDPAAIDRLETIARDYVRRRCHHVSRLLWCGGNELQGDLDGRKQGVGKPVDASHPCIARLKQVVEEEDPGVRFLPTSSSGPRFLADAADFGKGLHHDVHGPWNVGDSLEQWRDYWAKDDALFRSETGCPGASPVDLMRRYRADCKLWPPDRFNPYWQHVNSWWLQWDRFREQVEHLPEGEALARYVELSQALQAEALAIAAAACRSRFPRCGGFLIWMGHDAFPCLSNTSIIDYEARPKPAYHALRRVFCDEDVEVEVEDTPATAR